MSDWLLAPDDPLAPAVEAALETERLHTELDHALCSWPGPRGQLGKIVVEHTKYKPGEKAILGLRATIDLGDGVEREMRFALRIFPPGISASRFEKAQRQNLRPPIFGPAVLHLAGLDAIAWSFPNDRKLDTLAALSDAAILKDEVIPEVARALDPDARVFDSAIEIMHYVPEQACTVRLDLGLAIPRGSTRVDRLYGKVHYDDTGARTFAAMRVLSDALGEAASALGLASALLYQPRHRLLWQQSVPGTPLSAEQLLSGNGLLLGRVAAALAALHNIRIPALREHTPMTLLERLDERIKVTRSLPAAAQSTIVEILRRLHAAPPHVTEMVTLHGDLHPKNMFDDGERLYLIDFNAAARGLAEIDLGSFSAALIYHGALMAISEETIAACLDMLAKSYEERSRWPLDRTALSWATSFCLLDERLYRCLTRLKPGRRAIAGHLIAWADALSDNTAKRRAGHG